MLVSQFGERSLRTFGEVWIIPSHVPKTKQNMSRWDSRRPLCDVWCRAAFLGIDGRCPMSENNVGFVTRKNDVKTIQKHRTLPDHETDPLKFVVQWIVAAQSATKPGLSCEVSRLSHLLNRCHGVAREGGHAAGTESCIAKRGLFQHRQLMPAILGVFTEAATSRKRRLKKSMTKLLGIHQEILSVPWSNSQHLSMSACQ